MLNWDDMRVFLAAARIGTLSGAAAKLHIDAATVGRRIARLEASLRSTLFIRSLGGVELTTAGRHVLESAEQAESAMLAAARSGDDLVSGAVRISASEGFGGVIIAPTLPILRRRWPSLRVELAANPGFLSAGRREVDIAITLSPPEDARLVVEPLTDYQLMLYASAEYLDRAGRPASLADLQHHELVGYVDDLIYAPELRYLDEIRSGLRPSISSSSIRAQRDVIAAGGGVGVLPCFLGDGLELVLPEHARIARRFWMSVHADLADTSRVRALRRWLLQLVQKERLRLSPYPET
jgi:DNA-binding transcriptional LysR family regulator